MKEQSVGKVDRIVRLKKKKSPGCSFPARWRSLHFQMILGNGTFVEQCTCIRL